MSSVQLLDCTLRDGSYVTDFQFTARDTAVLVAGLEGCGLRWIEIGHGLGLNAALAGKGAAAATDEAYMRAASGAAKHARWGVFHIPGIGRTDDLRSAADCGAGFVRIGTNVNEVAKAAEHLTLARSLRLFVTHNLMKSYAVPISDLRERAKQAEELGAEAVYLVDSAGCMLPDEVRRSVEAMRDGCRVPIGFHGHDNLKLGMANVLAAIDAGALWIDATLQGMGRGGGNPALEILVPVLLKRGLDLGLDALRLMDLSQSLVRPMLRDKGCDPLDIICGFAGFHSSFLRTVQDAARRHDVDLRELIIGVCAIDRIQAAPETIEAVATQLRRKPLLRTATPTDVPAWTTTWQAEKPTEHAGPLTIALLCAQLHAAGCKLGVPSVLNVVASQRASDAPVVSRFVQEGFGYAIGSVEVGAEGQLARLLSEAAPFVNHFLVDSDDHSFLPRPLAAEALRNDSAAAKVVSYRDRDVWARALEQQVVWLLGRAESPTIAVYGAGTVADKLTVALLERGYRVVVTGVGPDVMAQRAACLRSLSPATNRMVLEPDARRAVDGVVALVAFASGATSFGPEALDGIAADGFLVDGDIGALSAEVCSEAHRRNLRVVRPDMRAALAAELTSLIAAQRLVHSNMGRREVAGVPVVSGGLIGRAGDVVVDSLVSPTRAIGVADGHGRVNYEPTGPELAALRQVERVLLERQACLT